MKLHLKSFFALSFILLSVFPAWAATDVKESVVKIYVVANQYYYYVPWQINYQKNLTGSGVIISGNRILTNAHVVADHAFIQVRRAGMSKKYVAEVETVAHECELAVLKVIDDSFFENVQPLKIGDLVKTRDQVAVYGFPTGGDKLSITEGVVSRIEHTQYWHSNSELLACQIDAAINPGNSGGPVIKNDKIVGVAFQSIQQGENIGYMVPAPIIQHFLTDIEDGHYDGIPDIGVIAQNMENPDCRLRFGMDENQDGILINKILPGSPAESLLEPNDIILSIDGVNIENDGTIEFRKGEKTSFAYTIQNKFINDLSKFKILRDKKIFTIPIALTSPLNHCRLVKQAQYDIAPTYFIAGGLVFEPLTLNYLKSWGNNWLKSAPINLLNYYFYELPTDDRKEVVILVKVLADEVNAGYHELTSEVISSVNGKKISTLPDLIHAIETNTGKYHNIVTEQGYQIVLDRIKVNESSKRIFETYNIHSDRSNDLKQKNEL